MNRPYVSLLVSGLCKWLVDSTGTSKALEGKISVNNRDSMFNCWKTHCTADSVIVLILLMLSTAKIL